MYSLIHNQKRLSYLVAIVFMLTLVFTPGDSAWANPAKLKDIQGHWGQATIEAMAEAGIVSGNPDGTYDPEGKISRSQFATLIVKAYNLKGSGKIFTDTASHWAKDYIAIANANGIVSGYSDSRFGPDDPITREQMAVMIVKAAQLAPSAAAVNLPDQDQISAWALSAAATAYAHNIIKGMPDGRFAPQDFATRAQAAVVVYAGLKTQSPPPAPAENYNLFDKAGKYGPTSGTITVNGNVTVKAPGVTLQNLVIKGDLIIAQEVGDGDVTLNNIKVEGKTYVRGGGSDSIHIKGGQYSEIIVEKTAGGQVRIVLVDTQGVKVTLAENAKGEEIILQGEIKTVTVKADNIKINTQGQTTIAEFRVSSGLTGINIELGKDSTVKEMILDSKATVKGEGTIKEASGSKAKESSFARQPDKITAPSGGGGGGGGSSTPGTNYSSIDKAGTYGPASGTETVNGSVTVKAKGVTLQNLIIKGDLIIAQEVGDGNVTLNNIQVTGKTYVRGGGKDSIHINGGQYSEVIVENTATGGVRIVVVNNQGIQITLAESATNEQIILSGSIGTVTVRAEGVNITTQADSQICQLNIPSGLNNVNINLAAGSIVNEMVLDSKATVTGNGTINEASGSKTEESSFSQDPEKVIYNADFSAVNSFGIHADKVYAGYELKDKDNKRIDLIANNIKTLTVLEPGSTQAKDLTVGDDNDPLLWFNVEKPAGDYKYTVETKAGKTYAATLKWSVPKTATWTATGREGIRPGTEDKYVEYKLMDGKTQVSLKVGEAKLFASKAGDKWSSHELNTDETLWLKKDVSGTFTYFIVAQDGTMYQTTLEYTAPVIPDPEVTGTMTAFGTGTVADGTATFGGEIKWYPADEEKGRSEGNRVGVKITMPEGDYDPADIKEITINGKSYEWETIKDGDNYFEWWPLVTAAGREFTATIKWNSASTQEFKIVIANDATLEAAPDTEAPKLGEVTLTNDKDGNLVLTVTATDNGQLASLEVDHSLDGQGVPEFTVGTENVTDEATGASSTFADGTWTMNFGKKMSDLVRQKAGGKITFYFVIKDVAGNQFGDMYNVTPEMTRTLDVPAAIQQYHTYKFNIADLAAEYVVKDALTTPTDDSFSGMTPIKLSIVVDNQKNKAYEGNVRVAAVGAKNLQLWAKDTSGNWYDINQVGWGPGEGFPIITTLVTDVYVVATAAFDGKVTLKVIDVTGDYGAAENIIISQDVAFKAIVDETPGALAAVNGATSADNYAAVRTALETNAAKLGLNLEQYNQLNPEGRKNAVANDIFNNKPEGGDYTVDTLKSMFNEIVATRLVFQDSVAKFAAATADKPLENMDYITMLQTNLNAATLQKVHSGKDIEKVILPELNGLVTDFNALKDEQRSAVLAAIDYTKNSSSTATRNALRKALDEVKSEP